MMRASFAICLAVLLAACADGPTAQQVGAPAQTAAPTIVDDRALLVLTSQPPETLIARSEAIGYTLARIDRLDALGEVMIHLRIPADRTIPEAIVEVEALEPGVTAGANHVYRVQSSNAQSGFANTAIGWPHQGCPAFQSIGLIDSGVLPDHPMLSSGRIVQVDFHNSEASPESTHGSLMADLLVGDGRLTAGNVLSANVIDPKSGDDLAGVDAILRAIDWLKTESVSLVNISLAGPFNKLLNRAMSAAAADGMVFVAAAGNLGPDAPPQFPAAFPYVLAVTAVDQDLAIYRNAVRGDHIDVAAPGVDVIIESSGKVRVATGTSVAAAFVTAALAADNRLGRGRIDAIRDGIAQSAKDLGQPGSDPVFGAGLVRTPSSCNS